MTKKIQAVSGMKDILPEVSAYWSFVEEVLRATATQYGYQEIRTPIVEPTSLFARAIGESTDIVEKEMYTFVDRGGDSLTLRPEGTAGCIRAGIEHGLLYNQIQRLFYFGPMFRHEKPQKGRYRQFYQFGVEAYGLHGPDIDVEMMLLAMNFWHKFKIDDKVELQINTLGDAESRAKYREHLVEYFNNYRDALDEDSKRRLISNPLRILDSKNPEMQEMIEVAPKLVEYLDDKSRKHFDDLCAMLDQINLPYVVNPRLVRGLDYYCQTVFEWVCKDFSGAQNTVCAGGHYDTLVGNMGGKPTPAIGFAMGVERLISLIGDNAKPPVSELVYIALLGERAIPPGMLLAEKLRQNGDIRVIVNCNGGDLKAQLKRADKSGADKAYILGDTELDNNEVLIKYLREDREQERVKL